jgi:hypothetical protein
MAFYHENTFYAENTKSCTWHLSTNMCQKIISIVAQFTLLEAKLHSPKPSLHDDRKAFVLLLHIFCQVGSISQNWDGVLKTIVAKADRFSIDFPPNIGKRGSGVPHSA